MEERVPGYAEDGLPGEIRFHARADVIETDGLLIGNTPSEPKQIRGMKNFCVISNYISNSLSTFSWRGHEGISSPVSTPVGLGPHGIDVTMLNDDTPVVVSTSATDQTYTLSHFTASGEHRKSVTHMSPTTCSGPKHAVFADHAGQLYVALSGHDSEAAAIIAVDVSEFQ